MKFSDLESFMASKGVFSLAEIARTLNTTPQAVSNWKSRDQVPNHIALKINSDFIKDSEKIQETSIDKKSSFIGVNTLSFTDLIISLSNQLKLIFLILFLVNFFTFIHVYFVKQPIYHSWATVLFPEKKSSNLGGLAGFATQFGVDVSSGANADLSSPSLFPELIKSRTFSEKILAKEFHTDRYNKKLPLLAILNNGIIPLESKKNMAITSILGKLEAMIELKQDPRTSFSIIKVEAFEPRMSKELAEVVVAELEKLNRFYKSRNVSQKTSFINDRISSVEVDLKISEQNLKAFKEQNRQVNAPSLEMELDRLETEVEIHKGIFLTLKQQFELAKIEEIQESSIVQILDKPQLPLGPSNKNIKVSLLVSTLFGLVLGVLFGLFRSFIHTDNIDERKKMRKIKFILKKKFYELFSDQRFIGLINLCLVFGLPFFLAHKSQNPIFFGLYSAKAMTLNVVYILSIIVLSFIFFINKRKSAIK